MTEQYLRYYYEECVTQNFDISYFPVDAVEANLSQVNAAILAFSDKPYYRAIVRQLISHEAQEFDWHNCFTVFAGVETDDLNCPKGVTDDLALELV